MSQFPVPVPSSPAAYPSAAGLSADVSDSSSMTSCLAGGLAGLLAPLAFSTYLGLEIPAVGQHRTFTPRTKSRWRLWGRPPGFSQGEGSGQQRFS